MIELAPVLHALEGTQLEPVGDAWAAYSAASGRTVMLNTESAAFLEVVLERARSFEQVAMALASDLGVPAEALSPILQTTWVQLEQIGLVRAERPDRSSAKVAAG